MLRTALALALTLAAAANAAQSLGAPRELAPDVELVLVPVDAVARAQLDALCAQLDALAPKTRVMGSPAKTDGGTGPRVPSTAEGVCEIFVVEGEVVVAGTKAQFLSHDPVGFADSYSLYAFAGFDPINNWDPFGLSNNCFTGEGLAGCGVIEGRGMLITGGGGARGVERAMGGIIITAGGNNGPGGRPPGRPPRGPRGPRAAPGVEPLFPRPESNREVRPELRPTPGGPERARIEETEEEARLREEREERRAIQERLKEEQRDREAAGIRPPPPRLSFPNRAPEKFPDEIAAAARVGVTPVRPGTPEFARTVNQGTINWVVTQGGQLLLSPQTVRGVRITHPVLSGGEPVLAAGEAEIATAGNVTVGISINAQSGHFRPSQGSVDIGRAAFQTQANVTFPR